MGTQGGFDLGTIDWLRSVLNQRQPDALLLLYFYCGLIRWYAE